MIILIKYNLNSAVWIYRDHDRLNICTDLLLIIIFLLDRSSLCATLISPFCALRLSPDPRHAFRAVCAGPRLTRAPSTIRPSAEEEKAAPWIMRKLIGVSAAFQIRPLLGLRLGYV